MDEDRQRERARQYAVCTYALRHNRASDGAEAIYDQVLTNGLAAIVAHSWPGEEMERSGGRTHSARGLLRVIEERGAAAGEGIVHVSSVRKPALRGATLLSVPELGRTTRRSTPRSVSVDRRSTTRTSTLGRRPTIGRSSMTAPYAKHARWSRP